jgi:hypothetical protein
MSRIVVICASVVLAACLSGIALADPDSDLAKVQPTFVGATFWHAAEHFADGRTMGIDLSAPDRSRLQASPASATKLHESGETTRKTINAVAFLVHDSIKGSVRDLGTQTLDGQIVHGYSYAVHGVPFTLYVRGNSQPVPSVVDDTRGMTGISCSIFHASISIAAP